MQTLLSSPTFLTSSPGTDKKLLRMEKEIKDQIKNVQKNIPLVEKEILNIKKILKQWKERLN